MNQSVLQKLKNVSRVIDFHIKAVKWKTKHGIIRFIKKIVQIANNLNIPPFLVLLFVFCCVYFLRERLSNEKILIRNYFRFFFSFANDMELIMLLYFLNIFAYFDILYQFVLNISLEVLYFILWKIENSHIKSNTKSYSKWINILSTVYFDLYK